MKLRLDRIFSDDNLLTKVFAGAVSLQVASAAAIGYASHVGSLYTAAMTGATVLASVFGGVAGAAVVGGTAALAVHLYNRRHQTNGMADMSSKVLVGGAAAAIGYIGGSIGLPLILPL